MFKYILPFFFALAACDTYVEDKRSLEFAPLYVPEQDAGSDDPAYGAIFNPNSGGLFSMESRAHRVGDILTVAFAESFQATKSQNAATSRSSDKISPTLCARLSIENKPPEFGLNIAP